MSATTSLNTRARAYAARMHAGQTYGDAPYTAHLDAVAALVPEGLQAIAYLHDVLEDTAATRGELARLFGRYVADCVYLLTDPPGLNRRERKAFLHATLAAIPPGYFDALHVKAADRLANLRACVRSGNAGLLKMYRREHGALRAAAYRPGLCDALWQEMEAILSTPPPHPGRADAEGAEGTP